MIACKPCVHICLHLNTHIRLHAHTCAFFSPIKIAMMYWAVCIFQVLLYSLIVTLSH